MNLGERVRRGSILSSAAPNRGRAVPPTAILDGGDGSNTLPTNARPR